MIVLFSNNIYSIGYLVQDTLKLLIKAIRNGELNNIKIIIRMLPKHNKEMEEIYFEKIAEKNNDIIILQYPGQGFIEDNRQDIQNNLFLEIAELFKIASLHMNAVSMSILEATLADVPTLLLAYKDCYYPSRFVLDEFESHYPKDKTVFKTNDLVPNVKKIINGEYNNAGIEDFLKQWHYQEPDYEKKIHEYFIN